MNEEKCYYHSKIKSIDTCQICQNSICNRCKHIIKKGRITAFLLKRDVSIEILCPICYYNKKLKECTSIKNIISQLQVPVLFSVIMTLIILYSFATYSHDVPISYILFPSLFIINFVSGVGLLYLNISNYFMFRGNKKDFLKDLEYNQEPVITELHPTSLIDINPNKTCFYHPTAQASIHCSRCKEPLCDLCREPYQSEVLSYIPEDELEFHVVIPEYCPVCYYSDIISKYGIIRKIRDVFLIIIIIPCLVICSYVTLIAFNERAYSSGLILLIISIFTGIIALWIFIDFITPSEKLKDAKRKMKEFNSSIKRN